MRQSPSAYTFSIFSTGVEVEQAVDRIGRIAGRRLYRQVHAAVSLSGPAILELPDGRMARAELDLTYTVPVVHVAAEQVVPHVLYSGVGKEADAVGVAGQHVVGYHRVPRGDDGDAGIVVAVADVAAHGEIPRVGGVNAGPLVGRTDVGSERGVGVLDLIMIGMVLGEGRIDGDPASFVAATGIVGYHVALRHGMIRRPEPEARRGGDAPAIVLAGLVVDDDVVEGVGDADTVTAMWYRASGRSSGSRSRR